MTLRTSFRSKLLILAIAPLAIAQAVTLLAVMRTVETDATIRGLLNVDESQLCGP